MSIPLYDRHGEQQRPSTLQEICDWLNNRFPVLERWVGDDNLIHARNQKGDQVY